MERADAENGAWQGPAPEVIDRPRRLAGVDAARGMALVGLMAVHILPSGSDASGDPSLSWRLFSGNSAALFALLAGVMLTITSGGRHPHPGRTMTAYRAGLVMRALLITVLGLMIGAMPSEPPAYNILIYYGVFFLLAIPFLRAPSKVLFASAAVFGVLSPVLMQTLLDELPAWHAANPTLIDVVQAPGATASQLLLTGTYPALTYLTYLLAGMGLGRLDLRRLEVQVRLVVVGLTLTVFARISSSVLLYALGGYEELRRSSDMSRRELAETLVWGPDSLPTSSAWWLAIATPHANTPLSIAVSLGVALAALGAFLLIARRAESWLMPLSALGAMTLTLYTGHLILLSFHAHYELPHLWFFIHLGVVGGFAVAWQRSLGKGPLERVIGRSVQSTRRALLRQSDKNLSLLDSTWDENRGDSRYN